MSSLQRYFKPEQVKAMPYTPSIAYSSSSKTMEKILNFSFSFLNFKFSTKQREKGGGSHSKILSGKMRPWSWMLPAVCSQFENFKLATSLCRHHFSTHYFTALKKIKIKIYMINSYLWMSNKDFKQLLQKCSIFLQAQWTRVQFDKYLSNAKLTWTPR